MGIPYRMPVFPNPIMIVRKLMIMMRILMIIITISDHLPFMIKPPALYSFTVYIEILS